MKMSQIDTENDEIPKSFSFSMILCLFSEFSTEFVTWNTENVQPGKHVLSSMLRKEIKAEFQTKTVRN